VYGHWRMKTLLCKSDPTLQYWKSPTPLYCSPPLFERSHPSLEPHGTCSCWYSYGYLMC
jgi:hypothetical protein